MNEDAKKAALRMIPYGMYVLTTKNTQGDEVDAATVNWVTQTSFSPPLVAVGVKADSKTHQFVKDTNVFAVNVISGELRSVLTPIISNNLFTAFFCAFSDHFFDSILVL